MNHQNTSDMSSSLLLLLSLSCLAALGGVLLPRKVIIRVDTKKYLILSLLILSTGHQSYGQSENQINDILVGSITSYIDHYLPYMSDHYYICTDGLPLNFQYDSIPNVTYYSVDYLRSCPKRIKDKCKKGIATLFVSFQLNNNEFKVRVTKKVVTLKKKGIWIGLSDWGVYYYEYSCDRKRWELTKTTYGGV